MYDDEFDIISEETQDFVFNSAFVLWFIAVIVAIVLFFYLFADSSNYVFLSEADCYQNGVYSHTVLAYTPIRKYPEYKQWNNGDPIPFPPEYRCTIIEGTEKRVRKYD